ncbi:antA/AntB antirepressor family protein [Treponema phagedenis]|uniref:antA/AntB antirepressor family protein n=1 Tax=Treponema phagedenis TaxID=162 RepID=UPI0015830CFE|nr:antA/AntB antirepressor family protein [Treponema phagedenis]QKS92581.1 antA/AntB antirepressor family protein [Treponema phagedenis]QKS92993.1 antA/AntB antirepressor family protein [Treponema phagedenis]
MNEITKNKTTTTSVPPNLTFQSKVENAGTEFEQNEILKIDTVGNRQYVNARELHMQLQVGRDFSTWIKERIEKYSLIEGKDYQSCSPNLGSEIHGGQNKKDYLLTVQAAKELAMVENNEQGRKIRQYLIKVEEAWNTPEMIMARALQVSQNTINSLNERLTIAEKTIEAQKPKVELADALTSSKGAISMAEAVKVLHLPFGRNTAFKMLRNAKVLNADNIPYQEYINRGYFRVRESSWRNAKGETKISLVTEVFQKGMDYLRSFFINKEVLSA